MASTTQPVPTPSVCVERGCTLRAYSDDPRDPFTALFTHQGDGVKGEFRLEIPLMATSTEQMDYVRQALEAWGDVLHGVQPAPTIHDLSLHRPALPALPILRGPGV